LAEFPAVGHRLARPVRKSPVSLRKSPDVRRDETRPVIKMRNPVIHLGTSRNLLATLAGLGLVALVLTGCEDDQVVDVDTSPPAVPTGVTTITGDEWVEVRWNPVYADDVAGYGVYRSLVADGEYTLLVTLTDPEADSYVDQNVSNSTTYYYAVDAYDYAGNESDLSYELAFDTPRPDSETGGQAAGPVTVYAQGVRPDESGIDFSAWNVPAAFVTEGDAAFADLRFHRVSGILYAVGRTVSDTPNDIQDLGWTETMDEVSWAPELGWSVSPLGVELIEGHTYVVWTWDLHYAKFRVVALDDPSDPSSALIDWAYQLEAQNPELEAYVRRQKTRAPEGRVS
jgi:hypothetical protein